MTVVYSPGIMARQALGSTAPFPGDGGIALEDPPRNHRSRPFSPSSGISPLSLPAPVRPSFTSSLHPAAAKTAPVISASSEQLPSSSSLAVSSASCGTFTLPRSSRSRSYAPAGSKYRSISANPPTRSRLPGNQNHSYAHCVSQQPPIVSPPSLSTRSSSSSERAKILFMEVERASWGAEKAGYLRHIQVLELKLKDAIIEKEEIQERLEAVITGHEDAIDEGACITEEGKKIPDSPSMDRQDQSFGQNHSPTFSQRWKQLSTFVPHDKIPGTAAPITTTTTVNEAVVEAQVDTTTSPGGTRVSESTVSTTIYHSEQQVKSQAGLWPIPDSELTEVLDVSTINPELEGIRLRVAAIQRPTFSLSLASPSLSNSTSESSVSKASDASDMADVTSPPRQEMDFAVRKSSKAQTLHVLATAESGRRRMHAGHTPSHSVSHFPLPLADEVAEAALGAAHQAAEDLAAMEVQDRQDEVEPAFEPIDDKPLRGHLMAQSDGTQDVFLDQFTKKLEDISSGAEDGVPAVLKRPSVSLNETAAAVEADVVGGTDRHGSGGESDVRIDAEADIPLKLKSTTNFGLPWGQLGRRGGSTEWNTVNA